MLFVLCDRCHPETAASPEQRILNCTPCIEVFPCQAAAIPATLAASSAADHVQADSSDVQCLEHVQSKLLAR